MGVELQTSAGRVQMFSWAALAVLAVSVAAGGEPWIEPCDDAAKWKVIAADGVRAAVQSDRSPDGDCIRLDYDFEKGSGFCVLHRDVDLPLGANYRVRYRLRGTGPDNNLELKLVDADRESVWWVNRREFSFPRDWRQMVQKKRHFAFAWGPSGGAEIKRLSGLEFAIASSSGGKGSVWIDDIRIDDIPAVSAERQPAQVRFSSARDPEAQTGMPLPTDGRIEWNSAALQADANPWILIDLGGIREFGGLTLQWSAQAAADYRVETSTDGTAWEGGATIRDGNGGLDYVPLPDAEARLVRVTVDRASTDSGVGLRAVRIMEPAFGEQPNRMFEQIAAEHSPGTYPRYFTGRHAPWTVVGLPEDAGEALINVDGMVEVAKRGFSLEPMLLRDGQPVTWSTAEVQHLLFDGALPIPTVRWVTGDIRLDVTALAVGEPGAGRLLLRYGLTNDDGEEAHDAVLIVLVRPFQVVPPWQQLNFTGGVGVVRSLEWDGARLLVNGERVVRPWTVPSSFGAVRFEQGDITDFIAQGSLPGHKTIDDPMGLASAALRYNFRLPPREAAEVVIEAPLGGASDPGSSAGDRDFEAALRRSAEFWRGELGQVQLLAPPAAGDIVRTWVSTQAYILINADGPAIQPGSRTYERSWIRDGALTSTALLQTGHADRVRKYIDWYAPRQFENGKVPCVVDRRGPDPVDEHDSTGELLYLLYKYYGFTRERGLLERHWPRVVKAVEYLQELRARRLTDEYRNGPAGKRVLFGLLPESISHEGYSAKPMHSYWDDFFALRGLKDAAMIARVLEKPQETRAWTALADDFRETLYDSMRLAMKNSGIDYVPGCAELGDFDATSTAIGVFPGGELGRIPEPGLHNTFKRYLKFFRDRRAGNLEWEGYTPYELRLVGTFNYLDQPEAAHELLDWFLQDRCPPAWNQWAEVVHHDRAAPKFIGDIPHTWVGSAFLNAVRGFFLYERDSDRALVLASGLPGHWLGSAPVGIVNAPTEYGVISFSMTADANKTTLELSGNFEVPPGGIVVRSPRGAFVEAQLQGRSIRGEARELVLTERVNRVVLIHP